MEIKFANSSFGNWVEGDAGERTVCDSLLLYELGLGQFLLRC